RRAKNPTVTPHNRTPRRSTCMRVRDRGFTLIELVVVVVIIGILAAVAYPAYTDQVRRSARSEVQSLATTAAARQSQFLVDRRRYAGSLRALGLDLPSSLTSTYTVVVAPLDGPPRFTITATAIGRQVYDKCPSLALDNAGNRTPAECW
ncbi:MAG TPA: type IV pilin protein, partial [Casimicrobiaceae bacterium]|nr:type IV pilin protein [Casimicrobiaceae bacterium]